MSTPALARVAVVLWVCAGVVWSWIARQVPVTFDPLRERLHQIEATIRELVAVVRELTRRVTDLENRD